ncbi:hypothetical protein F0L68_12855 [Solihabitans fulvus]|uniref:Uncharacterized protein n=1 Tax=Solihabitans fulvus TaxID=1892852 RepID=A0A5B2XH16_9PSEU|nr:hypothetical protein [Solihabitans fulvus]KAA2262181.1 hypothetical protein F0L68_12855 [Solihabitans fulvus]
MLPDKRFARVDAVRRSAMETADAVTALHTSLGEAEELAPRHEFQVTDSGDVSATPRTHWPLSSLHQTGTPNP